VVKGEFWQFTVEEGTQLCGCSLILRPLPVDISSRRVVLILLISKTPGRPPTRAQEQKRTGTTTEKEARVGEEDTVGSGLDTAIAGVPSLIGAHLRNLSILLDL